MEKVLVYRLPKWGQVFEAISDKFTIMKSKHQFSYRNDFSNEKTMPQPMDHYDGYSVGGFLISIFFGIMARVVNIEFLSYAAMSISILAGITTLIRNSTGDTLKTLYLKSVIRFKKPKKPK